MVNIPFVFVIIYTIYISFVSSLIYDTPLKTQPDDFYITKNTAKTHFRQEFLKLVKTRKSEHVRYKEQYTTAAIMLEMMNTLTAMDDIGQIFENVLTELAVQFVNLTGNDYVDLMYRKLEKKIKDEPKLMNLYEKFKNTGKYTVDTKGKATDDLVNPLWVRAVLSNCFLIYSKKALVDLKDNMERKERILIAHLVKELSNNSARADAIQKLYDSAIADVALKYNTAYAIDTDQAAKKIMSSLKTRLETDHEFSEDYQTYLGVKPGHNM